MADTGCQSCLASTSHLRELGLSKHHLHPVTLHMTAANANKINIAGALALRVSSTSLSGQTWRLARFLTSVTQPHSSSFPRNIFVSPWGWSRRTSQLSLWQRLRPLCLAQGFISLPDSACPTATKTIPAPTELLFPATEENLGCLEEWLQEYYTSSSFNVCEHQSLASFRSATNVNLERKICGSCAKARSYYSNSDLLNVGRSLATVRG